MSPTTVVNIAKSDYDVYIGRGSKWGNPFVIGVDGGRRTVIDRYREQLLGHQELLNDLHELRGKRLGCHCAPLPCHGDILAKMTDNLGTCNN